MSGSRLARLPILALLALAGCDRTLIVVSVSGLTDDIRGLMARVSLNGSAAQAESFRRDVDDLERFGLELPAGAQGALGLELEGFLEVAHKRPEHLARNSMGKVPALLDGEVPVSETAAIALYLADRYGLERLAPGLADPRRAAYLRWVVLPSAVMEPAFGEKFFKWEVPAARVGWGSFADMLRVLTEGVSRGKWLLGEQRSSSAC